MIYSQLSWLQGCSVAASYGMTDTMGRMHSDAQFAGSSSVPAHVEMMGFLGIGNNPMVGCTVACAVDVATALPKYYNSLLIYKRLCQNVGTTSFIF